MIVQKSKGNSTTKNCILTKRLLKKRYTLLSCTISFLVFSLRRFRIFLTNECAFKKDFWPIFIKPFWSSFLVFGLAVTWHAIKLNYKIWFDSHESESFYFSDCTFVQCTIGNINQGFCDLRDTDHACMLYSAPPIPFANSTVHM